MKPPANLHLELSKHVLFCNDVFEPKDGLNFNLQLDIFYSMNLVGKRLFSLAPLCGSILEFKETMSEYTILLCNLSGTIFG